MVSWVDCWCFREKNRIFQKLDIFWGSGGIFDMAKIGVFHGFQSSISISTLIRERKKLAPSSRSLSKALKTELSIEPSTKRLAIFVRKWRKEYCWRSDWRSSWEPPKFMIWRLHSDHFPLRNGYVPPKFVFLGSKLSLKNVTFVIYGPDSDGIFMRVNSTFPVSRVYPQWTH